MPTTTEGWARRAVRFVLYAALALAVWTAIVAALPFVAAPGASLAIIAPRGLAIDTVANAGGSIEEAGERVAITRSAEPGFARRLYASGALFVLDARIVMGCRAALGASRLP